jgi:hypothetical protein
MSRKFCLSEGMNATLDEQVRVSKMLGVGFACSILGVGGIASLVAFIIGLRARKIIKQNDGQIAGIKMAWWCIIAGALGTLALPPTLIFLIIEQLK